MSLSLLCTQLHPAIPAITAGMAIGLIRKPTGELVLEVPGSPTVLTRLLAAMKDGALILADSTDPVVAELEAMIIADRDRLLAEMEARLARNGSSLDQAG